MGREMNAGTWEPLPTDMDYDLDDEKGLLLAASEEESAIEDVDNLDPIWFPRVHQCVAAVFMVIGLAIVIATCLTIVHVRHKRFSVRTSLTERPRPPHHLVRPISQGISARALLEGSDLALTTSAALLAPKTEALRSVDGPSERKVVAEALRNISHAIRQHTPRMHVALERLWLRPEEEHAVLDVISHMSNTDLQRLGLDVANAVQKGKPMGVEGVMHHLLQCLQQQEASIRDLRRRVIPPLLRHYDNSSSVSLTTADLMNLHVVDSFASLPDDMDRQLDQVAGKETSLSVLFLQPHSLETFGIIGGVIEGVRVFFDLLRRANAVEAHIRLMPRWSRSIVGGADFAAGLEACVADGMEGLALSIMCPMRFASAGFDVLQNSRDAAPSHLGSRP